MDFSVGQRVVCTDNRPRDEDDGSTFGYGDEMLPAVGTTYTIRAIVPGRPLGYEDDGVLLEEIVNPVRAYEAPIGPVTCEPFFRAWRFRPARTTNIDQFLRMLEPVRSHYS
jgi:hypothetical protein